MKAARSLGGNAANFSGMEDLLFYALWFCLPVTFLLMALWGKLEEIGNRYERQNVGDMLRQGIFLLICGVVTLAIDHYFLEQLVTGIGLDALAPMWVFRSMVYPIVIFVAAKLLGPSNEILISKGARPSDRRRRRR